MRWKLANENEEKSERMIKFHLLVHQRHCEKYATAYTGWQFIGNNWKLSVRIFQPRINKGVSVSKRYKTVTQVGRPQVPSFDPDKPLLISEVKRWLLYLHETRITLPRHKAIKKSPRLTPLYWKWPWSTNKRAGFNKSAKNAPRPNFSRTRIQAFYLIKIRSWWRHFYVRMTSFLLVILICTWDINDHIGNNYSQSHENFWISWLDATWGNKCKPIRIE